MLQAFASLANLEEPLGHPWLFFSLFGIVVLRLFRALSPGVVMKRRVRPLLLFIFGLVFVGCATVQPPVVDSGIPSDPPSAEMARGLELILVKADW